MKKLKRVKVPAVGSLRIILSSLLFILCIINFTTITKEGYDYHRYLYLCIPFFLVSISMLFISDNKAISLACLLAALCSALNQNVVGDYSASIFFIFSFHLSKNKKYGLILIGLSILCISINGIIIESRIAVVVGLIIAYTLIYIVYYFFILKPIENRYNFNYSTRSEEEKAILKLYGKGYSYSEISKTLGMNVTDITIRRKIKIVKDESGSKNDVQFGQWLFGNV